MPLSAGDILQIDRYALLVIGVVDNLKSPCIDCYQNPEPVLKVAVLCHHSTHTSHSPPTAFSPLFSGVSKPFSHRAIHCFGVLRGVSPEGSRNVVSLRGGSGRVTSPLLSGFNSSGIPTSAPTLTCRSKVVRESLEELGRPPRVPAPGCWYFGKQSMATAN